MKSGTMKLQKLLKRMKALGAFNECVCVGVCVSCNIRGRKSVFPKIWKECVMDGWTDKSPKTLNDYDNIRSISLICFKINIDWISLTFVTCFTQDIHSLKGYNNNFGQSNDYIYEIAMVIGFQRYFQNCFDPREVLWKYVLFNFYASRLSHYTLFWAAYPKGDNVL